MFDRIPLCIEVLIGPVVSVEKEGGFDYKYTQEYLDFLLLLVFSFGKLCVCVF